MLVAEQIKVFLMIMALGVALAFLSDCYQVSRRLLKPGRFVGNAGDIVFWIVAAGTAFLVLLHINLAELRLYIFLGLFAGWMAYALLFSYLVKSALWWLLRIVVRIFQYIVNLLLMPLVLVVKTICFPGRLLFNISKKILNTFKRKARFLGRRAKMILPFKKPPTQV